jgi:hypothetical protein
LFSFVRLVRLCLSREGKDIASKLSSSFSSSASEYPVHATGARASRVSAKNVGAHSLRA